MNPISALQDSLRTELELFRARLSSIAIVEIGTIESINENGRAVVHGSSFVGGVQTKYQDAEVIFPGNNAGTYYSSCVGATCLIFIPRSNMVDTVTRKVRFGSIAFDTDGVKVMPISNGTQDKIKVERDSEGSFNIRASNYIASFSDSAISVERNDGTASVSLDPNGDLHVIKQTDNGTYYKDLSDGTATETWLSKDKDVQWVSTLKSDGSRTLVQNDPRNPEGDPLFSLSIDSGGKVVINTAADISVSTTGDANVSADGDVSIDANSIKLNGSDRHLVAYEELQNTMDILYTALTTTPIAGEGATQPTWAGLDPITKIDISAAKIDNVVTGAAPTPTP